MTIRVNNNNNTSCVLNTQDAVNALLVVYNDGYLER